MLARIARGWSNIQLYALMAGAVFVMAIGIYAKGMWRGIESRQAKIDNENLKALRKARKVEGEVNALDNSALRERARKWVR